MAIIVLVSWLKSLRSAGLWVAQPGGVLAGRQAAPGGGFTSGGVAQHIRLTNVFDLPSIDVAAAPAAPTAKACAGCAGGCSHQSHISPAPNTSRAGIDRRPPTKFHRKIHTTATIQL